MPRDQQVISELRQMADDWRARERAHRQLRDELHAAGDVEEAKRLRWGAYLMGLFIADLERLIRRLGEGGHADG